MANAVTSVCFCKNSAEAIDISKNGEPHVHCPCDKCKGKATWRMTAWRHIHDIRRPNDRVSDIVSKSPSHVPEELDLPSGVSDDCEEMDFSDLEDSSGDQCAGEDTLSSPSNSSPASVVIATPEHDPGARDSDRDADEQNIDNSNASVKAFVRDAVLRLLEMKDKLSCSEKHFEELLEWGKQLHADGNLDAEKHWPNNWNEVQNFLSKIGFVKPKHYWICLSSVHPCHYGLMESCNELCPHCGQPGNIPYYYLSLTEKVKNWCSCPEMCKKISAHWSEKDHWLPDEMKQGWGWNLKRELWDGTRFAELSYFWNPVETWILPVRCPLEGCCNIVSSELIMKSPTTSNGRNRLVTCKECGTSFSHCPSEVTGDPRNIALCRKYT